MMNDNVKCTQSVLVKVQDLKKYFDVDHPSGREKASDAA